MQIDPRGIVWDEPRRGGQVNTIPIPQSPQSRARDARDAAKMAQDAENDRIRQANEAERVRLAKAEEDRKAAEWAATHNPDGSAKIGTSADDMGRMGRLNSLVGQINRTQELNNAGPGATSGISSLMDYLPTDANARFDTAGASLAQQGLGAFRVPGSGTVSDRDAIMFDRANLPASSTRDATNEEILRGLRARVEEEYRSMGAPAPKWVGGPSQPKDDKRDPFALIAPNGSAPPAAPNSWDANSTDPTKPSSGLFLAPATRQQQSNPAAADLANKVFAQTGSMEAVNAALAQAGLADRFPAPTKALIDYNKQKPGYGYFKPGLTTVQNSAMERLAGGAPAAGVAGFTNTMTGGAVKALGGQAYDDMAIAHPYANATGEIGGAIGATAAIGKAGAALARKAAPSLLGGGSAGALGRGVATDATYGGIYGGMTENDPLSGAALGAAGSLAGRGVGKVAGRAIQGIKPSDAAQYLSTQGIPLTLGQTVGGAAKTMEDRMTSIPMIGDMVNARRMEGVQAFNRAGFRQAGEPIGANVGNIGKPGLADLYTPEGGGAVDQAYNSATAGVRVPLDSQWPTDLQGVAAASNRLPPKPRQNFAQAMDNTAGVVNSAGELTGDLYQNAMRSLKGYKGNASTAAGGFDSDYKDALSLAQGALRGQMERGGGQSAVDGLGRADAAYRNYKTLADAVNKARNGARSGEVDLFMPSQLNDAVAATQRKFPGAMPLAELGEAGQRVLPSSIPDSGTAGRLAQMALPSAVGGTAGLGYAVDGTDGAQAGGAGSLGLLALMALGGTKAGQKALKKALTDSGSLTRAGAARLVRKGGGLLGKSAVPLFLE